MAAKCRQTVVSVMKDLRALPSVGLLIALLLHPSVQFTLGRSGGEGALRVGPPPSSSPPNHGDATSVLAKPVASDNASPLHHTHSSSPHHHRPQQHVSSYSDSALDTISIPPRAHTRPLLLPTANRETNRGSEVRKHFRTRRHRLFGETPTENARQARAEEESAVAVVASPRQSQNSVEEWSTTKPRKSTAPIRGSQGGQSGSLDQKGDPLLPVVERHNSPDIPFTKVVVPVAVKTHNQPTQTATKPDTEEEETRVSKAAIVVDPSQTEDKTGAVSLQEEEEEEVEEGEVEEVAEEGERQLLQQAVAQGAGDAHGSKMVLTAIGSFTAILGVCVMAAIFQCCCRRRKRSTDEDAGGGQHELQEKKKGAQDAGHKNSSGGSGGGRSSRSSKSPSPPHITVTAKDEEEQTDKGQPQETDTLLEEDQDLGDFSAVQRETSILRSYRKPAPPKNRARASRAPRTLKGVDPSASPNLFQELVASEDGRASPQKGPTQAEETPAMNSSMLADIDSTLAALHTTHPGRSPSRSADRSREPSADKQPLPKSGSDNELKPPPSSSNPALPASPSKEQLAKALAQEISRSVSKEMLSKPQSKAGTPTKGGGSRDSTPKSQSADASPKTARGETENRSASAPSKNNVECATNGGGISSAGKATEVSAEDRDKNNSNNFFALIDPTTNKDKASEGGEGGGKSKIPVRAGHSATSSPSQPTAPLRLSVGRDKRFPVPSVHGDQMDQLMKSLKTRLKDEENTSPKKTTNTASPETTSPTNDDLDPQSRDRSHSDPTKQRKDRGKKLQQTQL